MEEGEGETRDGRAEGSSSVGDGGQAAMSLTPAIDGSCSLLEPDACSHIWKSTAGRFICRGLSVCRFTV